MSNQMSPEFKNYLIESLKNAAMTVHDLAEQFVGDYKFTGDLDIHITIGCSTIDRMPEINISKSVYPDIVQQQQYINEFNEERKKSEKYIKDVEKIKHTSKYKKEIIDSINPYNSKPGPDEVGGIE